MLTPCLHIYTFSFSRTNYIFSYFKLRSSQKCKTPRTKKSKTHLLFLAGWTSTVKSVIKLYSVFWLSDFPFFQNRCLGKTENNKLSLHSPCWTLIPNVIFTHAAWWDHTRNDIERSQTVTSILKWNSLSFAMLLQNFQNLMSVNEWHTNGIYKFSPFCCI